ADHVWLGKLQQGRVLVGVEPGPQVLGGVKAVHGAVLARACALWAENLDAEVTGELARRGDDPSEELLVDGLVTGLDAPGHRGRDGTAGFLPRCRGRIRSLHLAGQVASASLNCSSPIELPCGS